MLFVNDIYRLIFSYIKLPDYVSVLLVCTEWRDKGYEYLDFSVDQNFILKKTVIRGNSSMLKRLLKMDKIDPSIEGKWYIDAVFYRNLYGIANLLLRDKRLEHLFDESCLTITCLHDRHKLMKLLLKGSLLDSSMCTKGLFMAVRHQSVKVVKLLLKDKRTDPSGPNIIITASEYGNIAIIDMLLKDPRVDHSIQEQSPIVRAAGNGRCDIVKRLLMDKRVNPFLDKRTVIAVQLGWHFDVEKILKKDPRYKHFIL